MECNNIFVDEVSFQGYYNDNDGNDKSIDEGLVNEKVR